MATSFLRATLLLFVLLLTQAQDALAAKRKVKRKVKQPELSRERVAQQQDCEMCGLVMSSLQRSLTERKAKLQLSKDAAQRRETYVEGVQKAQTKRWLHSEYGVEMVDALEEALDGLCEREAELVERVCGVPTFQGLSEREVEIAKMSTLKQPYRGIKSFDPSECRGQIKSFCLRVVESGAEMMQRAALEGGGPEACVALWSGCSRRRARLFHNSTEEKAAAVEKFQREHEERKRRDRRPADAAGQAAGLIGDLTADFMSAFKDEV